MNDGYSTGRLPKNKLKVIFITILTTNLAKSVKIENSFSLGHFVDLSFRGEKNAGPLPWHLGS